MKKRVISLMLVLVTVIGLLPLSLLAADTTASATTETVNAAQYLENGEYRERILSELRTLRASQVQRKRSLQNMISPRTRQTLTV